MLNCCGCCCCCSCCFPKQLLTSDGLPRRLQKPQKSQKGIPRAAQRHPKGIQRHLHARSVKSARSTLPPRPPKACQKAIRSISSPRAKVFIWDSFWKCVSELLKSFRREVIIFFRFVSSLTAPHTAPQQLSFSERGELLNGSCLGAYPPPPRI